MPTRMPTTAAPNTTTTPLATSIFQRHPPIIISTRQATHSPWQPKTRRGCLSCQVALTTEVPSSSLSDGEDDGLAKIGARVRVTAPLKVYHVAKAPDLDLCGMEGTIKQFVGLWKGKSISANLPFKVEFFLDVEGEKKPVKFLAHLKEDEFEYVDSATD